MLNWECVHANEYIGIGPGAKARGRAGAGAVSRRGKRGGDRWLDGFIPYQLYRITNALNQRLRARLRRSSMSLSRWRVLSVLRAFGTLSINEIAALTVMEQPTVSRTVSRLVRDGLVDRRAAQQDSRVMEVSLTPAGHRAFEKIYPIAVEHQSAALDGFSSGEIESLRGYLQRIQDNLASAERKST